MPNFTPRFLSIIPPRHRKRLLHAAVAVAATILLLFLAGYRPERRDLVFRAMPSNSILVSEHLDIHGVWRERFSNPLISGTLAGFGVDDVEEWAEDEGIIWITRLVAGRRSLIGWTPALGPAGEPCWTGASWAGLRGPLLRAMLLVRWVPGLGRLHTTPKGTRYLETISQRRQARGETGPKVAFYLRDNVLFATLGEDPDAALDLARRMGDDKAALATVFGRDQRPWRQTGSAPHRAWVAPPHDPTPPCLTGVPPLEARVTEIRADRLDLVVMGTMPGGNAPLPTDEAAAFLTGNCTAAGALAADAAGAMVLLPAATARRAISSLLPGLPVLASGGELDESEDAAMYITTGELGGRLVGLAVPALTLLVPASADDPGTLRESIARIADASRLPLRTYKQESSADGRLLVDWMGGSRHIRLAREDCIATELHPGWLIVCSSAAALDAQRRTAPEAAAPWREDLRDLSESGGGGALNGFAWIDLARTAYELRQVYAVLRLAIALGAFRLSADETAAMNLAGEVQDALHPRGTLAIGWRLDENTARLAVRLRAQEEGAD